MVYVPVINFSVVQMFYFWLNQYLAEDKLPGLRIQCMHLVRLNQGTLVKHSTTERQLSCSCVLNIRLNKQNMVILTLYPANVWSSKCLLFTSAAYIQRHSRLIYHRSKRHEPLSDFSLGSSLIWVHILCIKCYQSL